MTFRSALRLVVLGLPLLLSACTWMEPHREIEGNLRRPNWPNTGTVYKVGSARVDITPIPGLAMSYKYDGRVSRGFWTRLYARAIYVEDKNGKAMVFVSCEIPAIPNGLRDTIAEEVYKRVDHIGRSQILLAATHTHNGPQNYFSSKYYNTMPAARSGYDPELHAFLAGRIADAVAAAAKSASPGGKLKYRKAKLAHFFRNRSLAPFLLNPEAQAYLDSNDDTDPTKRLPDDCARISERDGHRVEDDARVCRAVRAWVEVIEFMDAGNSNVVATAAFLAAHPTVLDTDTEVYNGDVLGAAASLIEQGRVGACGSYKAPVMAFFNGAEGDVSMTWTEQGRDRAEVEILAKRLAELICGASPGILPESEDYQDPEVHFQFRSPVTLSNRSVDSTQAKCVDDDDTWHEACTSDEPKVGMASMGGAQDGRTYFYGAGFREGMRAVERDESGRKVEGIELPGYKVELTKMVSDPDASLEDVSLGVYWLGPLVFATLPGEFTTLMGERIRGEIDSALATAALSTPPPPGTQRVLLVGLANSRVSYVTTPEEYDAQFYEGAQNLFGAATGTFVKNQLVDLADRKSTPTRTEDKPFEYDPGSCRVFLPKDAGTASRFPDDGLDNILMAPKRDLPDACWVDAIPDLYDPERSCTRPLPYVWIEATAANASDQCKGLFATQAGREFLEQPCEVAHANECTGQDPRFCVGGVPQDNCGLDLVTVLHGSYEDRTRWCAFWLTPQAGSYEFCVAGVTNENIRQTPGWLTSHGPISQELDLEEVGLCGRHQECDHDATRNTCEFPTTW